MVNLNFLNSNNDKHKSIRIKTEIGDKFLNVNLDQTYESLDILSVKVFQKDVYRLFDADYGIIVGRVNAKGVGIPNCRVSVFVPIDEDVITNPLTLDDITKIEAAALYPYETVYDKDAQGKIFNLLPKYSKNRNLNGFPDNEYGIGTTPKTPVGTFPEKEEILVNETLAYVYDKYYKYTTITNESGDYILTVPANRTYTVNMSCDITDIGRFSTTASLLKMQGTPSNFFTLDGLKINPDLTLESLPNIDIQNKSITVKPLWSQNTDNTNVGINRLDFELIKTIQPFVTIIGNQFTQNPDHRWEYAYQLSCGNDNDVNHIQLDQKYKGKLLIDIYNIKTTISENNADELNNGNTNYVNNSIFDIDNDIEIILENKDYLSYQDNGNFIFLIICNRNKVITDEIGNLITVDNDNDKGVFTSFRGYFYGTNDATVNDAPDEDRVGKVYLKIPQLEDFNTGGLINFMGQDMYLQETVNKKWIWRHYKFDFGNIYSVAQRLDVQCPNLQAEGQNASSSEQIGNQTNILYTGAANIGTVDTATKRDNINDHPQYVNFYNHLKLVNSNGIVYPSIKNQWINFSLYFENFKYNTGTSPKSVSNYITRNSRLKGNEGDGDFTNGPQRGAGQRGVYWLANGDYIKTNFILVDKTDLIKFYDYKINNIKQLGFRIPLYELKGTYLRESNPGGNVMNQDNGDEYYFLIGANDNNVLQYLIDSKII